MYLSNITLLLILSVSNILITGIILLTLLHSERSKLYTILTCLSAVGLEHRKFYLITIQESSDGEVDFFFP